MTVFDRYLLSFILSDIPKTLPPNSFKVTDSHEPTKPVLPKIKIFDL